LPNECSVTTIRNGDIRTARSELHVPCNFGHIYGIIYSKIQVAIDDQEQVIHNGHDLKDMKIYTFTVGNRIFGPDKEQFSIYFYFIIL
jgi:hypothetical protein